MRREILSCSAGIKAQPPRYAYETASYYQFQWIAVMEGELRCESEGGSVDLTSGGAALLRFGSAFRLSTGSEGYRGVFYIDPAPEEAWRGLARTLVLPPALRNLTELMHAEGLAPQAGSQDMLLGIGRVLAWKLIRLCEAGIALPGEADYGRQCAERAREALRMALTTSRTAQDILAGCGLSYRQLSRYFLNAYGLSPKRWLLAAKIREAQARLRETDMPVTALAYELGFSSSQHFASRFAMETGASPSAYRKRVRRRLAS